MTCYGVYQHPTVFGVYFRLIYPKTKTDTPQDTPKKEGKTYGTERYEDQRRKDIGYDHCICDFVDIR